jgi:large subunit ribosomal protein L4
MAIKKLVTYTTPDGLQVEEKLNLNVLEKNGKYLIHKDILRHQINLHYQLASTKTRSEVRGGGRKPWSQKGTGRARAGSSSSPLWKGGGVVFGPKPKKINCKLNQKERKLSLQTLLYNKRNSTFIINKSDEILAISTTKAFKNFCKNCGISLTEKLLLVVSEKTSSLLLAVRNFKNVELILVSNLNTLSLLKAKQILLTAPALSSLKEIYED